MILFHINDTSGWEQVLLPPMLLPREDFVQGEVLKKCFGRSCCCCTPWCSQPSPAVLSLTHCSFQNPPWGQSPAPALPVPHPAWAGAVLEPDFGLSMDISCQHWEIPGKCGCCRCQTPCGRSCSIWGHLSRQMSEQLVPSFKGEFVSTASWGQRKEQSFKVMG